MNKDPIDLPVRRVNSNSTVRLDFIPASRIPLNSNQVSSLIEKGGKVADGVMSIAKELVDISRIKAESQAEVAGIEARSHAMVAALRAETERLMEDRKGIRTRGEAAVALIKAVLEAIPESDHATRQIAIIRLNQLVATVVSPHNISPQSQYD